MRGSAPRCAVPSQGAGRHQPVQSSPGAIINRCNGAGPSALAPFADAGISARLISYSALDRYFRVPAPGRGGLLHVSVDATVAEIAPLVDELQFGSGPLVDAIATYRGTRLCVRCSDGGASRRYPFTVQHLRFDPGRGVFLDPDAVYYDLRKPELVRRGAGLQWWQVVAEAAQLASRYHFAFTVDSPRGGVAVPPPPGEYQRNLLEQILTGPAPDKGLRLLHETGIVASWWPELAAMANVDHAKEYHPEGDVWEHTLATFAHRKSPDLMLSLGLLLHDAGKPQATPRDGKRFFAHAEIGARVARRFLARLGFAPKLIDAVAFLSRNHMMPAALGRVRPEHAEELMSSNLFPHLLELYRADMMSSFASPEPYYHACRLYQRHLRGRPLPQRTTGNAGRRRGPRPRARRFKG